MGWKKEFKKFQKEQKQKRSSVFDFSDGISSIIEWNRSMEPVNYWTINNLIDQINTWNEEIKEGLKVYPCPDDLTTYEWSFSNLDLKESFYSYPMASYFQNTYNYVSRRIDNYFATLLLACLTKYSYYTTLKFWKVFNYTFANKNINDKPLARIFEVMQRTCLDAIENIIQKAFLIINNQTIDPYRDHLLVEEIIDLGDDYTYHWSKMLDQVIDLTVETYMFEAEYGRSSNYSYSSTFEQDDFEDFFEKTQTMVFNDEVNDAFNYFGLTKMSKPEEFKKVYRKLAKQFHPDINKDPSAATEMKKINVFKTIIEQYYDKYQIV